MPGLRIAIAGAGGRMGAALLRAAHETAGVEIAGALERPGAEVLGRDVGENAGLGRLGIAITDNPKAALAGAAAILDFTSPASSVALAKLAARGGLVHVVGTTGFSPAQNAAITRAAKAARIVKSGNMSLGVALLAALVERAASTLPDFDIEIAELHHRHKKDAPSGTALMFGEAAARGRKAKLDRLRIPAREGETGARRKGAIGFAALRGGTVVGEHRVILAGEHERIELVHVAEDRAIFAQGALRAALWAVGQPPGLYDLRDVLGLSRS